MLKIRLKQTGKRNMRGYRVVVCEERGKRDGKFVEEIGSITPTRSTQTTPKLTLDKKRLNYWIAQGAQLTDGIRKLL